MKTETLNEVIQRAMDYPLQDVVARYARDYDLAYEDAERHVFELRRFLALCATNSGTPYGMRGQIDNAWHTFIMFTRDYSAFCNDLAGRYIHHQPDRSAAENSQSLTGYESFLRDYEASFGEPAPADLWPRPFSKAGEDEGCNSCGACGVDVSSEAASATEAGCEGCNGCRPA